MYQSIFDNYEPKRANLIYILHDIQNQSHQNYVSEEAVNAVSKYLNVSPSHIYGVLTFYTMYSTKPRGKYVIRLCESSPCWVKGSDKILKALKDELQVGVNHTTDDKLFTIELCACLGVCGNAPVVMINDDIYGDLTPEKITSIVRKIKEEDK